MVVSAFISACVSCSDGSLSRPLGDSDVPFVAYVIVSMGFRLCPVSPSASPTPWPHNAAARIFFSLHLICIRPSSFSVLSDSQLRCSPPHGPAVSTHPPQLILLYSSTPVHLGRSFLALLSLFTKPTLIHGTCTLAARPGKRTIRARWPAPVCICCRGRCSLPSPLRRRAPCGHSGATRSDPPHR